MEPPKESPAQRYKLAWRLLLIANLGLGAYMFARAKRKDSGIGNVKATAEVHSAPVVSTTSQVPERPELSLPIAEPVKVRQPIPVDQQRELFKWILEEKRKDKPKDPGEKKRIDEEKAILKQFIRAESIPSL